VENQKKPGGCFYMDLEVGEIVLCTVDRIAGTTVFVNIEGTPEQGYISLSEIAPGRIRNIRDYVVPKKVIICKILKISGKTIELSLRRVTPKEQKELKEKSKLERNYKSVLKTILKEKLEKIIQEIQKKENLVDFLEGSKEDPKKLEKLVGKQDAQKILIILNSQKTKKAILKKTFKLYTKKSDGLNSIKQILLEIKQAQIKYISAGKYSIKVEASDLKKADQKIKEILEDLEKKAKKQDIELSLK